jgi:hypothetical protein
MGQVATFGFYGSILWPFGAAFTDCMSTCAVNIWSLFHRFTLGAAILSRRHSTGTDGVRAFLAFVRHIDLLSCSLSDDSTQR